MTILVPGDLENRYRSSFGHRAGYLPRDLKKLKPWFRRLERDVEAARRAAPPRKRLKKSVAAMAKLIRDDSIVRMFVTEMLEQQHLLRDPDGNPIPRRAVIKGIPDLIAKLDHIVNYAPWFSDASHFPMSALFTYVMMTPAGESLFRNGAYNDALTAVLQEWCRYLDSRKSLEVVTPRTATEYDDRVGWLSPQAYGSGPGGMKLWEFYIPDVRKPHWGFRSYNDYFHRRILDGRQPGNSQEPPKRKYPEQYAIWLANATEGPDHRQIENFRPVSDPEDPRVIVSANDGTVSQIASNVRATDRFWLKGTPYSLIDMLNGLYVKRFVGGRVLQSFLSGANYHRWHAPIDGIVRHREVVQGLTFSEARSTSTWADTGTNSEVYESAVNTRGLVFIESPKRSIGMVCVIPIGITEISSITITAEKDQPVKKGDPLGYFSYGGSTLALVFQKGAVRRFTVRQPDPDTCTPGSALDVNAKIAIAS